MTFAAIPVRGSSKPALVDLADLERLKTSGLAHGWYLAHDTHGAPHVCAPSPDPQRLPVVLVARMVAQAAPHERVLYRDRDRMNLQRDNLQVRVRPKPAARAS